MMTLLMGIMYVYIANFLQSFPGFLKFVNAFAGQPSSLNMLIFHLIYPNTHPI